MKYWVIGGEDGEWIECPHCFGWSEDETGFFCGYCDDGFVFAWRGLPEQNGTKTESDKPGDKSQTTGAA